jgi:DNA mismatch endonuclease (patch repair protein)
VADIVSPKVRSRMMAGIRSKNTKPELIIRKGLHRKGFRFRLHDKGLLGKPDLVLPRYQAVVFVNGCFWHGHDCQLFRIPATRTDFWKQKISKNKENDKIATVSLSDDGWRIATVWECALKGKGKIKEDDVIEMLSSWLKSEECTISVRGNNLS